MFDSILQSVHSFLGLLPLQHLSESVTASLGRLPNVFVLLVCAALLAAQLLAAKRFRREFAAHDKALRIMEEELHAAEEEVRALLACSRGVGDQLHKQQRHMRTLLERQQQIDLQDSDGQDYRQAVLLLQKGASTEELMSACSLSRAEADLLVHMYKLRQAA